MRYAARLATAAFAMIAAARLLAADPTPPPTPGPDIIIEAQRRHAIRQFVESLAQAGPTDQLGRWKDEICPAVAGIDPGEAQWLADPIVEIARTVEVKRGPSNCAPTLIVIVTPDPGGVAKEIASDFPTDDGVWRIHRFLASDRPVRWMTVTEPCGEPCALPNSRLVMATAPTFIGMLILVDANRIAGFKLGELADYVALVGLSNPKPGAQNPSSSILSMFDMPRPPSSQFALTDRDRAFLSGLYRTQVHSSFQAQKGAITNVMKRELAHSPSPRTSQDSKPR